MHADIPALNLARTSAALAAYDAASAALDALDFTSTRFDETELLRAEQAAKREVGRAFAFDTADRNDPADAARYAAFNPERVRDLVSAYRMAVSLRVEIAQPAAVNTTVALTVKGALGE